MEDQRASTGNIVSQGRAIFRAQANDQARVIPYRPQYNLITGSPTASILLQQIAYWWEISGRRPFYKFRAPCEHDRYKPGDSWSEELGFSVSIFDGALKHIAKKITKGVSKAKTQREHIVTYWTDSNRITWYEVNEELLAVYVYLAYNKPEFLGKLENPIYLDESGNPFYLGKEGNPIYLSSEMTSETTTEENDADALFYGENGKPEREPFEVNLPETDNPQVLEAHCAGVRAQEGVWTQPEQAGGNDPWADKPLKTFCVLAGRNTLKDSEKTEWSRQLREWAVEWGATPDETCQALLAIPESESEWKTFSWPGGAEFKRTMDAMIDRIRSNLPINSKGNGNGRHDKPAQPTVVVFPEPEYLMVDGV